MTVKTIQGYKMEKIIKYITNKGGFARMKDMKESGFQTRDIAKLLKEGLIEKIKPGVYRLSDYDSFGGINVSFLTICKAVPNAVICLISALDYHELTTQNPWQIYYAIPNSEKEKKIEYPPNKPFYFRERFYNPGIEEIKTKHGIIKVYNKEKTICDMFRYRNKLGEDIALEALKTYLRSKQKKIPQLIKYAEICQVKTVLMPILKGLVA